jgi:hypothetical protein
LEIAATVNAFSKSAVWRHSRHFKGDTGSRGFYRGQTIWTLYPGDSIPANAKPNDWLLVIEYERAVTAENAPNAFALLNATERAALLSQKADQAISEIETVPPDKSTF